MLKHWVMLPTWQCLQHVALGPSLTLSLSIKREQRLCLGAITFAAHGLLHPLFAFKSSRVFNPMCKVMSLLLAQPVVEMVSDCCGEVSFLYISIMSQKENNVYCQCLNTLLWGNCLLYEAFRQEPFPVLCFPQYHGNKKKKKKGWISVKR